MGSIDLARQQTHCVRLTTHTEFENTGNIITACGRFPFSKLQPERLGTIDEESAAEAALVLANEKERRSRVLAVGKLDSNCPIPSDGKPDKRSPF